MVRFLDLIRRWLSGKLTSPRLDKGLFEAMRRHDVDRVRELLEQGANVNQKDEEGWTPLDYVINDDGLPAELVGELLERGANPNLAEEEGTTALMVAPTPLIPVLVAHGADVNARDRAGDTPLIQAASHADVERLRVLLEHGAEVNAINGRRNALIVAVESGRTENVRLLLAYGADITPPSGYEWIGVILAAASGDKERVLRLLDQGGLLNVRTSRGESAVTWAVKMGHLDIKRALKDRCADCDV